MAPGRDVSVQEFAGLFPIGTDSSVLPAADNGGNSNGNAQASGANFSPFTIDALDPVGTNVLAGPEPLPNFVTPPQTGPFVLQQPAVVAPTIVVNSIASLTLSEANLTAATNGVDGSTHNLALTHVTGNFAVDFADKAGSTGISSVSYALSIPANGTLSGLIDSQSHQNDVLVQVNATTIEGHVGSATGALAFTISVNPATGVVTFTEDRAVDNNAGPVSLAAGTVTLTQTVVDSDGGKASASVDLGPKLSISDDHPTASPDTATAQDGGPAVTVLTGNVASVIGNDLSGADTPINVTAVVATSNGNLAGTVGTALTGEFGKLTLNADGTFSYTANHNVLVGSKDVFTYTVTDDDGTTSSTTLTITIAAGQGPVAGGDSSLSVNESALAPNGSGAHLTPDGATTQVSFTAGADDLHVTLNASALTTLLAGFPNLVWTTAAGGQEIVGTQNGVTVVKFDITAGATIAAGTTGQVTVTETLLAAIQGEGSKSPDLGTLNVVATDTLNGGSVTDHITANVVDDHPTANPDTATAQDGGPAVTVLTGNVASVMANDVSGADTPINVTAVVATSNGNLAGTVGTALTGEFGKLTLNADGTFSYTANHNVLVGSKDVFTYTITDDDGTTSSTTLTITIAAGQGPVAGSDSSLSVNESALAPNGSGVHLTPDVATTQVSFTAGADDLHVTLNASALTTLLAGFPNLVWTTAAGGQEIVGTQNGVTVVKFDITAGATIAAGTTGQVTVTETLVAAIQGEGSKSPDLGTLNVVATDTLNGGSVTDHITANVVDDKPIWTSADHGVIANVAGISVTGGLQFVTGADGLGLIYFTGVSTDPLHPTATTIQSGGFAVSEYVDANGVLHGVANGAEVFKVVLDPTTSTYTFYLEHALDSYTPLAVNPAKLGGSGPVWYATLADTSGNPVTILTGYHTTPFFDVNSWFNETHDTLNFFQLSQDTVKASSTGEGVHSNVFDAGDFMRFDFGSVGDNSHGDTWIYGTAFGAPAVATGNQISFSVKTLGGGPSIIDYVVHSIDGTVTHGVYNSSTDGAGFTANGHGNIDYVEMYEVCGKSKILLAGITELVNNGQTDVPFTVGVKDGDGDIASGSFDVNVNGGTTLSGTAGNDVIVAGATNETLTGNGGNDKFVLNLAAHFTISDFNSGDLVLLDVSGLSLPAGASNPLTASQFTTSAATGGTENNATAWNESGSANKFFFNNATHELWYSANGTGSDKVDLAHLSTGVPAAANIHIF
ncbi:beta strand repeat-containing protein [Bradyrhizobium sp.]|uniref:beta strand repeat-containing protein n=1 Tax=Bradyrhizobium sp. TaxID=376 RepID=UPI00391C571B